MLFRIVFCVLLAVISVNAKSHGVQQQDEEKPNEAITLKRIPGDYVRALLTNQNSQETQENESADKSRRYNKALISIPPSSGEEDDDDDYSYYYGHHSKRPCYDSPYLCALYSKHPHRPHRPEHYPHEYKPHYHPHYYPMVGYQPYPYYPQQYFPQPYYPQQSLHYPFTPYEYHEHYHFSHPYRPYNRDDDDSNHHNNNGSTTPNPPILS